jgi:hypothetical protein
MQEIPDEVSLIWIARFLGEPPSAIYKLNREGQGPLSEKKLGQYVVKKPALLAWLANQNWKGKYGKQ